MRSLYARCIHVVKRVLLIKRKQVEYCTGILSGSMCVICSDIERRLILNDDMRLICHDIEREG